MSEPYTIDLSAFDANETDEQKIMNDIGIPCRICEHVFRRIRITWRYCAECHQGFCEGEHGTFARGGRGTCIQCGPHTWFTL